MFNKAEYKLFVWFVVFSLIPVAIFPFFTGMSTPVIWGSAVSLVCSVIFALFVAKRFAQPLLTAATLLKKIAQGELQHSVPYKVISDERGQILLACQELTQYLKSIHEFLTALSQGDFDQNFPAKSRTDEIGNACTQLINYFHNLASTMRKITEGQGATVVPTLSNRDKLGVFLKNLTDAMSSLNFRLKDGVQKILTVSQDVVSRSTIEIQSIEKLLTSTESTSSSMAEMQASVEEVGMNIEALAASIEATSSSIGEMGSSISQVTRNSEKLSEFVETTSGIIAQAVSAMEKVSENAENSKILSSDTMRDASKGQDAMRKMSESVQTISQTVGSASVVIQQLEARSDEIGGVLDVIDEIADQTSLLALNASIIAAQAGEHGKGFAVVADEIKDLANRVFESTKEISRIVKTVQQDSARSVEAMSEGSAQVQEGLKLARLAGDALEKIILGAQWSANVANDIADAIQEQTSMNQSIENSIQDVVNVVTENTRATKEQEIGASRVMEAVGKMTSLADQVHRATIEQTKGSAEVINATEEMSTLVRNSVKNTQQLLDAAKELFKQAEVLSHEVSVA